MSTTLRSCADVATASPQRYAEQLVSHLGHQVDVVTDGATSTRRSTARPDASSPATA